MVGGYALRHVQRITVDYTVEFARVFRGSSPDASFSFLSGSGADPTEILNQVDDALNRHTAPGRPADDINIIVLQYPAA